MSSPLIWIAFPGVVAAILYIFQRRTRLVTVIGFLVGLALAWAAWKLPIGGTFTLGPLSLRIADTLTILGRRFILADADRTILILIYLIAAFWFGGAFVAQPGRLFVPLGLGITALMTAALAVEPFLYAALLIEIAALVSIPILTSTGKATTRGVLRFITFQTLGTPILLFTGWLSSEIQANPNNPTLALQAAVLLGISFSFLLAVFPFHTWIPMLAEESHPYAAAFVFFMLPGIVSLFGLSILDRYSWLRSMPSLFSLLRTVGAIMVVTGGVWAAFQRHLGRMLGYAVLVDIGLSIMALGVGQQASASSYSWQQIGASFPLEIFFAFLLSRGVSLGAWALSLSAVRQKAGGLDFDRVRGVGRQLPLAAFGLILAHFSMSGFPLLAGFPARLALWNQLAQTAPLIGLWTLIGCVGLLVGGLQALAVLVTGPEKQAWRISERGASLLFLLLSILIMVGFGLFPRFL